MRKLWDRIPPLVRGLALVALAAIVVVALSLESVLATVGGLLQIAFFLAVAFFLFLLWRERRGDLEVWSDWNRKLFYSAIVLAVVDVGMLIGLRPSGPDAFAFFVVLCACVYVLVRVWRIEHRL
jgi:quinol-cytochrome oxidoreductase complex cytochrome b subunit